MLNAASIMEIMNPHVSIDRDAVSAFCQRHYITRLALFGSVLTDDFGPDSDVDVPISKTQSLSRGAYDADENLRSALIHLEVAEGDRHRNKIRLMRI